MTTLRPSIVDFIQEEMDMRFHDGRLFERIEIRQSIEVMMATDTEANRGTLERVLQMLEAR